MRQLKTTLEELAQQKKKNNAGFCRQLIVQELKVAIARMYLHIERCYLLEGATQRSHAV